MSYCNDYGMDYHDNKNGKYCETTTGQEIGEFLLGSTIFRGIKKSIEAKRECTTDGTCKTKFGNKKPACINYKCQTKNGVGKECWRDTHCESNVCKSGLDRARKTAGAIGKCKECWTNKECKGNKLCKDNKCVPYCKESNWYNFSVGENDKNNLCGTKNRGGNLCYDKCCEKQYKFFTTSNLVALHQRGCSNYKKIKGKINKNATCGGSSDCRTNTSENLFCSNNDNKRNNGKCVSRCDESRWNNYSISPIAKYADKCGGRNRGGSRCLKNCCEKQVLYCKKNCGNNKTCQKKCLNERGNCSWIIKPPLTAAQIAAQKAAWKKIGNKLGIKPIKIKLKKITKKDISKAFTIKYATRSRPVYKKLPKIHNYIRGRNYGVSPNSKGIRHSRHPWNIDPIKSCYNFCKSYGKKHCDRFQIINGKCYFYENNWEKYSSSRRCTTNCYQVNKW